MSDSGQQKDPFESVRKQIEEMHAGAHEPAPAPQPKYPVDVPDLPDLSHLEERTKRIRDRSAVPQGATPHSVAPQQGGTYYRGVGVGFAILYAFIGPILLGLGIGWFVDRGSHGGSGIVWGALIGTLCGFIGGIVTVVRLTSTDPKL